MNHRQWLEGAEIYALGALDGDELVEFEAHLASGCRFCEQHVRETREVLILLPRSLAAPAVSPGLRTGLLDRIAREPQLPGGAGILGGPGFVFVRSTEGQWQEIAPGVLMKVLYLDPERERATALVRMAAGSCYGSHRHAEAEELYVLEGSCHCAGQLLLAGDYHRAEGGSVHGETHTDDGCLMLVVASQHNEMLA